jgi:type IV fimbrial biogenesis protein FimT
MKRTCPSCAVGRRAGAKGFTLIELLVTIAIAGILMMIAAPSLQATLAARSVGSQSTELLEAMHFARAEAIKRSAQVTVCKSAGGATPTCSTAAADSWRYWVVFADYNGDGTKNAGEPPLRVQNAPQGNAPPPTATSTGAGGGSVDFVRFQANGLAIPSTPGNFVVKYVPAFAKNAMTRDMYTRQVCVNTQGRASVVDGSATCP